MTEQDTVKIEIEVPKENIRIAGIEPTANDGPEATSPTDTNQISSQEKLKQLKEQLAAARQEGSADGTGATTDKGRSLIKAPLDKLPTVKDKSPPNNHQKIVIGAGLALALIGLILWPLSNFILAISVALLGGAIVSVGTFVKV